MACMVWVCTRVGVRCEARDIKEVCCGVSVLSILEEAERAALSCEHPGFGFLLVGLQQR